MPTVKRWADDLRAVFGADEMRDALKSQGYYASEGGRTVDTRTVKLSEGVPVSHVVIGPQAAVPQKGSRGR
jgi:hypothetical protein